MADLLPEYRVKARNTSADSENGIHSDAVARQHGFPGALVPGITVYAYLTNPLVMAFGTAWLDRGTANLRLLKPILDGEEVTVIGEITEQNERGISATVRAMTARIGECAVATVTLPSGLPTAVNLAAYRQASLPAERPVATRAHLASLDALGTPIVTYDDPAAAEYVDKVSDSLALYRGPGGRVHPAFLLQQCNRALSQTVKMSPWIHVASAVRHLGAARIGDTLRVLGKVRSLYEKKGREYVEADLAIVAGERRPIAHVLHTAIYLLGGP